MQFLRSLFGVQYPGAPAVRGGGGEVGLVQRRKRRPHLYTGLTAGLQNQEKQNINKNQLDYCSVLAERFASCLL